jgi:hypothetical protein
MKIKPAIGIGDLLILKMYKINNNIKINTIIISEKFVQTYRSHPKKYIEFLNIFIHNLFENITIQYEKDDLIDIFRLSNYNLNQLYLFDYYKFKNTYENIYGQYIVFHTKARFDYCSQKFNSKCLDILSNFFQNVNFKYKILILGERNVEQNIEAKIHNIISLYNILILMKNNNEIIDLTYDELYSGNEYNDFEKDCNIINNAICNIGFGYGGSLNICMAFSKTNIFYIDELKHDCLDTYNRLTGQLFINFDDFFKKINKYSV